MIVPSGFERLSLAADEPTWLTLAEGRAFEDLG